MFTIIPQFSSSARAPHCSFCGRGPGRENAANPLSSDRPVITTELDIDFEGTVEFCIDCGKEIGALVGLVSQEEADALRAEAEALAERLAESEDALHTADEAVKALLNWTGDEDDEDA